MRKLAVITTAAIVSVGALMATTTTQASVGQNIDAAIAVINPIERVGCYRWGETGYHWYRFCIGPHFLYPHQRVCRHGYCYYR